MGTYTETGSTDTILEATQPAVAPGSDRLQGSGQQSTDQAQDGTWIVVTPVWGGYHRAFYAIFDEWDNAYDYWRDRPESLLCKNQTPA